MKVLTAAQMQEVDRRTIDAGIPGLVLMENAGNRVVDLLVRVYSPLREHVITVVCGKGNNGGDGLVVARQLHTRFRPRALNVVLAAKPEQMHGDAASNARMLAASGCPVQFEITEEMRGSTLVIDAILGTGVQGPATGRALELIQAVNGSFPDAEVVAVDIPSGLESDSGLIRGEFVRADHTVTFTAPKLCHVLAPACDNMGKWSVEQIGSPPELYEQENSIFLSLSEPHAFRHLFGPRPLDSNKGRYGHLLVVAGSRGKSGAAALAGVAGLRAGAGLVTVASPASAIATIAAHASELMTEPMPETPEGSLAANAFERLEAALHGKNVVAVGPGLGSAPETVALVRRLEAEIRVPMVLDADGLNALAGQPLKVPAPRILTPHPGEMARLANKSVEQVQSDRTGIARTFAQQHGVHLVLKGHRSVIAAPDGRVWINPTGSPALATGGTGDVLTGLVGGLLAQFPGDLEAALLAAVYLHGRAGELGAAKWGEKSLIATDLYAHLPGAMDEIAAFSHRF